MQKAFYVLALHVGLSLNLRGSINRSFDMNGLDGIAKVGGPCFLQLCFGLMFFGGSYRYRVWEEGEGGKGVCWHR